MTAKEPSGAAISERINAMVERSIQRSVKGLDFIRASSPVVGQTPKVLLHEQGTLKLYHYLPTEDEIYRVPIVIVMATTNRGYLFDLAPGQSMVQYLMTNGFDVYMIDWDAPGLHERGLDLGTYTQDFIPTCIEHVMQESGEDEVSIMGYCMGGVLSLIYAATHADGPLKNLVCLTTPVDWHEMGLFRQWCDERFFDVDRLVDTVGIIPEEFIAAGFDMLRPAQKLAGRTRVWEQMWNDEYVKSYRAFDRWGNDILPLAGEYYRETTRELMWRNKLLRGNLEVRGRSADLANITVPVMHAIAEHDHIVPYAASKPLLEKVSSDDREELVLKGGHVSLIAGPNAVRRMWPAVNTWLSERSI